ncbi:hypothetical protein [Delftia acidovorans]|uniref:hypothetical protein n=1 Tax=Delftia acidovorans TaxID=80866 RepID=UPI00286F33BF|nr:hypothetical protein [Delftia acidovorans]
MSGSNAFLALWNGLDRSDAREEYEAWHAMEHVPERVGLPGFLWGRRYVRGSNTGRSDAGGEPSAAGSSYFTVYGLQGLDALQTAQYADVIAHPTPWSARMRPRLSAFVRRPCALVATAGASTAAHLVAVRASAGAVPPALDLAYPVGGERIAQAGAGQTTVVLLAEHCTAEGARQGAQWLLERLAPWSLPGAQAESFVLQSQVVRGDLPADVSQRPHSRLPPRLGPMNRYFSR